MKKYFLKLGCFLIFMLFMILNLWAFDCKYFSFELPGDQTVKVGDSGVYVEGPEGRVYIDDSGVKVSNTGNTSWVLVDNKDRTKKEGDYYVFFQHNVYKVNLKATFYKEFNQFYSGYQSFINTIKSKEEDVTVTKSSIPNDYNRTVYKIVVLRDNDTKSIFYTVSSDYGFYVIEFSGKTGYLSTLSKDLKHVIDTFIPKY